MTNSSLPSPVSSLSTRASSFLKRGSPHSSNKADTSFPLLSIKTRSVSANGSSNVLANRRPPELFPTPIYPTMKMQPLAMLRS